MDLMIFAWVLCLIGAMLMTIPNPNLTRKEKVKVTVAIVLLFTLLFVGGRYAVGSWEV